MQLRDQRPLPSLSPFRRRTTHSVQQSKKHNYCVAITRRRCSGARCNAFQPSFQPVRKESKSVEDWKEDVAEEITDRDSEINGSNANSSSEAEITDTLAYPDTEEEFWLEEKEGDDSFEVSEDAPTYLTWELDGCNVLIRVEEDGRMDLTSVFFLDTELGIFSEPQTFGEIPQIPAHYGPSEWKEEYTGDTLMEKEPWSKVKKLYLLGVQDTNPEHFRMDLETVFCLDAATRTLRKEVVTYTTDERNLQNLTLRIRPEGCTIEENSEIISEFDLVEEKIADAEEERVRKAEESGWTQTGWKGDAESLEAPEGPRDPIDALNDDEREYDETFEDTPEVDQGY